MNETPLKLRDLAKQIRDREEIIGALVRRVRDGQHEALKEALLQGADLIEAKASCKHGDWTIWLLQNCPSIEVRTAQNYMRLSALAKTKGVSFFEGQSLSRAYQLAGILPEPIEIESRSEPIDVPGFVRASRDIQRMFRDPIEQWDGERKKSFVQSVDQIYPIYLRVKSEVGV